MKIDLTPLLKNESDEITFEFDFSEPDIAYYGDPFSFRTPVEVRGSAKRISDQLFLETEITASLNTHCARCLKEIQREIRVRNFEELKPVGKESALDQEDNVLFYKSHSLDLLTYSQEQITVNLPVKAVCSDKCVGLCTGCGGNLNEGICQCDPDRGAEKELDPRMAQLREWFQKENG